MLLNVPAQVLTISLCHRSMYGDAGPKVADVFYEHLMRNGNPLLSPDPTEAALALHNAVGKLRERKDCSFKR